jgi:hypothetical protein
MTIIDSLPLSVVDEINKWAFCGLDAEKSRAGEKGGRTAEQKGRREKAVNYNCARMLQR